MEADPAAAEQAEDQLIGDVGEVGEEDTAADAPAQSPGDLEPVDAVDAAMADGGRPLPDDLRVRLERSAGQSIEHVRVHDGASAGEAADALAARAFAHGPDIFFAPGEYSPESVEGQELIAHEVLHTLQPQGPDEGGVTEPGDAVEQEADAFARKFAAAPEEADPQLPDPAPHATVTRGRLPRFPGVVPEAFAEDKVRFIDPTNEQLGKVWEPDRGYIRNPSATPLSSVIKNGKVGGGFENGTYMYVVDDAGEVWVGKRQGKQMPHPTLLGGKEPKVRAAGMVRIEGGKIVKVDNHSGHYKPPRSSLKNAVKSFVKLPKTAFKNFAAESIHFDGDGNETRRAFRSLRMLKLKSFNPSKVLNRLRMRYKHDPKFKGGLKNAGRAGLAIIAMLVAQYFIGKWMAEAEAEEIRTRIAELAPEVEASLLASLEANADTLDKLYETAPQTPIYLNVVYRIANIESYYTMGGEVATSEAFAGLSLKSADVSVDPVKEGIAYGDSTACIGSVTSYRDYSMSEAVMLSDLYDDQSASEPEMAP